MIAAVDPLFIWANRVEALVWIGIGFLVWLAPATRRWLGRRRRVIAAALIVFGCSDFVEAMTGAWWRPWWLLVWKVGCIIVIVAAVFCRPKRSVGEVENHTQIPG